MLATGRKSVTFSVDLIPSFESILTLETVQLQGWELSSSLSTLAD
jgi:hypothetical protein